jgi:geranylgeranyl reductase
MTLRTRALVIGGGPAGSTAARVLAGNGVDTLLVEKNFSYVKPCGGGIPSTAFDELEMPRSVIRKHADTVTVVSPKGEKIDIKLAGGSIAIVERGEFDSVLRAEAERSGARLLEAEFTHFEKIGRTAVAQFSYHQRSGFTSVEADYVVAADGVNSRVRTALGIEASSSFLALSERIKSADTDACEFWFGSSHAPRAYSWVFPRKEGVSVGTAALERTGLRDLWQKFLVRRGLRTEGFLRGFRIPLWQGDLYNLGRVLFVGDAAGQVMPFTCEGIYYSMKSGEMAAMAILGGKTEEYKRLWKKRFYRRFSLMKRLWQYFLRDDIRAEKIVLLHKRPEVQKASMSLWLRKDLRKESLLSYTNIFRGFLN